MRANRLRNLCLVTAIFCNVRESCQDEAPRRSFLSRRAIDGTRGSVYFDPDEDGAFDSYGSAGGQYEPYEETTDFSDIRRNVPGEPGIDYPAYRTLPQTGFTCEGRSRGYYADEAAGCQVFHVCHDVLVSSFLCPMGSIFSQRLLTCDWWTKVDCSATGKYIGASRDNYQPDDDEMIRNAYAMIGFEAGQDLVDPDRTGTILEFRVGQDRRNDLSHPEGNDIRPFEDYSRAYDKLKIHPGPGRGRNYYSEGKSTSPYHDSPIIRIRKIENHGQGSKVGLQKEQYDQFQPSYAPTVPTVTTTTRRFYSPTVPTTQRPSTLAYNTIDQLGESSNDFYSRSKESFVTPPTRVFPEDRRAVSSNRGSGSTEVKQGDLSRDQDRGRRKFRINVPDFSPGAPVAAGADSGEEFEVGGSIGLGHALHQPQRRITVQEQDTVDAQSKPSNRSSTDRPLNGSKDRQDTLDSGSEYEGDATTTVDYESREFLIKLDTVTRAPSYEESSESSEASEATEEVFVPSTTSSPVESSVEATEDDGSSSLRKESIARMDLGPPAKFLKPPKVGGFRINVPDGPTEPDSLLNRYSTIDTGPYPGLRTTDSPSLDSQSTQSLLESAKADQAVHNEGTEVPNLATDIVPPLPHSEGQARDQTPKEVAATDQQSGLLVRNDTEGAVLRRYNENLSFTIRDAGLDQSVSSPPCSGSEESCSTSFGAGESAFLPVTLKPAVSSFTGSTESPAKFDRTATPRDTLVTLQSSLSGSETILEPRASTVRPVSRPIEDVKPETPTSRLVSTASDQKLIDTSTADNLFRSIRPETLEEIEEKIEQSNRPYQVTLTVNKDEDLGAGEDLIGRLIAGQQSQPVAQSDFEVIRSTDTGVQVAEGSSQVTRSQNFGETRDERLQEQNRTTSVGQRSNTVGLLQLMAELLKLDRYPRPFSASDRTFDIQSQGLSTARPVPDRLQPRTVSNLPPDDQTLRPEERTTQSKEFLLRQLAQSFGQPLYEPSFQLPEAQRSLDFRTGLPLGSSTRSIDDSSSRVAENRPSSTSPPITEKTIVKTELVPSIGFSFDTNEGREEYVQAVLGGLIDEHPESTLDSERNETQRTI